MENVIMAPSNERSNFLRVLDSVAKQMGLPSAEEVQRKFKVYDDMLLMPQPLSPTTTFYAFNPVTGVDTPVPTENKIDKNDWFAITGVGLRFTRADYASATGLLSNYGNYDLLTYPYANFFSGAAAGANKSEADALKAILRGTMSLQVTNDLQWQLPCSELVFEQVNYAATPFMPVFGGGAAASRGILPLSSIILLDGGSDNKITLTLSNTANYAAIDGSVSGATTRNLIVPVLQGIRIKNIAAGGYSIANCRI